MRLDISDVNTDVFRSGNSLAVRVTHKPTGIVITKQEYPSEIQNRRSALKELKKHLAELEHVDQS